MLKDRQAMKTLSVMGLTTPLIVKVVIVLTLFMGLALVFVNAGISAFGKVGSFDSMVNSLFPLGIGAGAASGGDSIESFVKKCDGYIKLIFKTMKDKLN